MASKKKSDIEAVQAELFTPQGVPEPRQRLFAMRLNPPYVSVAELAVMLNVLGIQIREEVYTNIPNEFKHNFVEV